MESIVLSEITRYTRNIKTRDHAIVFYDSEEAMKSILFPYLLEGLRQNKGVIYNCSDQDPEKVREEFYSYLGGGFDFDSENILFEDYDDWYVKDGEIATFRIINKWRETRESFAIRGLGLRVAGETYSFFRRGLVRDLLRYEYALHRVLDIEMDALCAYHLPTIVDTGYEDVIMPLIRAHGKALFLVHGGSIILEPQNVEDTDVEKLLDVKIH
jgi:hypothetical protein